MRNSPQKMFNISQNPIVLVPIKIDLICYATTIPIPFSHRNRIHKSINRLAFWLLPIVSKLSSKKNHLNDSHCLRLKENVNKQSYSTFEEASASVL